VVDPSLTEVMIMDGYRSQASLVAASLLVVVAMSAFVAGVFILFGAWVVARGGVGGALDDVGAVGAGLVAILAIAFGVLATAAAHEEWLGRPRGRMLGLVVAVVALLAAVVPLLVTRVNGNEPLFYLLGGLAVVTAVSLFVPDPRTTEST
jgi:hypothetical protein